MIDDLTEDNFLLFAAKYYNSPHYTQEEFFSDLKRIKYIKKIIHKYRTTGELKDRLLLNHIIMFYNVFEKEACTRMLFFRVNVYDYGVLKTFLEYLNIMPDVVDGINGKTVYSSDIAIDFNIQKILNGL